MKSSTWKASATALLALLVVQCAEASDSGPSSAPAPRQQASAEPKTVQIPASEADRLRRIMGPLIQHMNKPLSAGQVKIAVWDDPHINAANAGGGQFFVTTGLLAKASDEQLRGVLAHEVAHEDLGHVASTQTIATGIEAGAILLEQLFPSAKVLTPLAGQLLVNAYTRGEEKEADAHGVAILKRAGQDGKSIMASTLEWIRKTEGDSGGGFFASHPATGDRIAAVQALP